MGVLGPTLGAAAGGGAGGIAGMLAQLMKARQGVKGTPPIMAPRDQSPTNTIPDLASMLGGGAQPRQPTPVPSFLPPEWAGGPPNAPVGDPSLQDAPLQDLALNPQMSAFMQALADRKPAAQPQPWWAAGMEQR